MNLNNNPERDEIVFLDHELTGPYYIGINYLFTRREFGRLFLGRIKTKQRFVYCQLGSLQDLPSIQRVDWFLPGGQSSTQPYTGLQVVEQLVQSRQMGNNKNIQLAVVASCCIIKSPNTLLPLFGNYGNVIRLETRLELVRIT